MLCINSGQDGLEEWTNFTISYRLPPACDLKALRATLERWAYEDDVRVSCSGAEVAYQATRTTPLARAFIQALQATGMKPVFKNKSQRLILQIWLGPFVHSLLVVLKSRATGLSQRNLGSVSDIYAATTLCETRWTKLA